MLSVWLESHAVIFGRLLLKYLRHFRHCSLPSVRGLSGVSQKGHASILAKLRAPSRFSNIAFEPRLPESELDRLIRYPKITTAKITTDMLAIISGQIDAQTFDTYSCMNGLWVYSRYSHTASSRFATD